MQKLNLYMGYLAEDTTRICTLKRKRNVKPINQIKNT